MQSLSAHSLLIRHLISPSDQEETLQDLVVAGARGLLAEEEERLFRLRQEIEGEARQELDRARVELEEAGRTTQAGKLCATPFGVDVVGITEFIALTGALVGGRLSLLLQVLSIVFTNNKSAWYDPCIT